MAKSLLATIREFFGLKPGQTVLQFAQEWKTLDDTDRKYFQSEFARIGVETTA